MEKEVNAKKMEAAKAALEKANKEAGYDVPLAFAALNTVIINAQMRMDFPRFERETAAATIADVVVRAYGGKLDVNAIGTIVEAGIAYGWHRAIFGENPFSSGRRLAAIRRRHGCPTPYGLRASGPHAQRRRGGLPW